MAHQKLDKLLDDLEIDAILDASLGDLSQPLAEIPGYVGSARFDASGEAFSLFGRSIPLRGEGDLHFRVHDHKTAVEIEGLPALNPPSPGQTLVDLELECNAAVNPTRRRYRGPRLELVPRGDAGVRYRHVRTMPSESPGKAAAIELASKARLPSRIDLDAVGPQIEIHRISGRMRLNLDLNFEVGWRKGVPGLSALLDELGDTEIMNFDLAIKAGFGLEMAEEFALTVGRGPQITRNPSWVRACIHRKRRRGFTFGAQFALTAAFQLGNPLELLLDRLLERRGCKHVFAALAAVGRMRPAVDAAASGEWQTLASLIGAEASSVLQSILLRSGAFESRSVELVLGRIVEIANTFDQLAPEAQGLWETVLDRTGFRPDEAMLEALEHIATLADDPENTSVTAFLQALYSSSDRKFDAVVFILELLTGLDLENLVVGSDTVHHHLQRASEDARRALDFFEQMSGLPIQVIEGLRSVIESTRAGALLTRILEIEEPNDLATLAGTEGARLAQRLIGRKIRDASASDLRRIKRWALRLQKIVQSADVENWIRSRLRSLDGELGFSLGLELEILTRRSRILDVELSPSSAIAPSILSDLGKGKIRDAVNGLTDDQNDRFVLHDCVFTSHRSRAATLQVLLSVLGWRADVSRRVTEDWIRLQIDRNGARRKARFSGGMVRRIARSGRRFEGAAWLSHRVEGVGNRMDEPFDAGIDTELRFSCSSRLDDTTPTDLRSLDDFLFDLGLSDNKRWYQDSVERGVTSSLALALRFGPGALDDLLEDLNMQHDWCIDARNALHRWFIDQSVDVGLPGCNSIRRGQVLASLVRSPLYAGACSKSSLRWEADLANSSIRMVVPDRLQKPRAVNLRLVSQTGGAPVPYPPFAAPVTAIQGLLKDTRRNFLKLATIRKSLLAAPKISHSELADASSLFCKTMLVADNNQWPSPFLPMWLVIARLARMSPEALANARGVATIRFRQADAKDWEITDRLTTKDGIRRHLVGYPEGIFPIGE